LPILAVLGAGGIVSALECGIRVFPEGLPLLWTAPPFAGISRSAGVFIDIERAFRESGIIAVARRFRLGCRHRPTGWATASTRFVQFYA
jgi:hypothetical protein